MQINDLITFLKTNDNFVIFTHADPDPDAVGSAVALTLSLRKKGKKASAYCDSPIPARMQFMHRDQCFGSLPEGNFTAVSVDVASPELLGDSDEIAAFLSVKGLDLVIDHHKVNTMQSEKKLVYSDYSSCGEIIYEICELIDPNLKKDEVIASCLYAAMSGDSGCFKYSSTAPRTMEYAAELMRAGIDHAWINRQIFETKSMAQIEIERLTYNSIELYYGGKVAVSYIKPEDLASNNLDEADIEAVSHIPRQIAGVEVSLMIRPKNGRIKVSLRSNNYFDVATFAAEYFGGGGHKFAAGCSFADSTVDEVKDAIITSLGQFFS